MHKWICPKGIRESTGSQNYTRSALMRQYEQDLAFFTSEYANEADKVLTNAAIQTMYAILKALFKRMEGAYVDS